MNNPPINVKACLIKQPKMRAFHDVMTLEPTLQEIGLYILDRNEKGESTRDNDSLSLPALKILRERLYTTLSKLETCDRIALFSCFCPSLAVETESGYQVARTLPRIYSFGFKLYCCADIQSKASLENAGDWIKNFLPTVCAVQSDHLSVEWLLESAPWLGREAKINPLHCMPVFVGVLNEKNDRSERLLELLHTAASGESQRTAAGDAYSIMHRHVPFTLLVSSRPDCWELAEQLLLTAKLEEGLRESIISAMCMAHPQAFIRMLSLITEKELTRYKIISKQLTVYFGFSQYKITPVQLARHIELVSGFLAVAPESAVWNCSEPETIYCTLWALGVQDLNNAFDQARPLLVHENPEVRFVALYYLTQCNPDDLDKLLSDAILDADERIRVYATNLFGNLYWMPLSPKDVNTEVCKRLSDQLPTASTKYTAVEPIVWPWMIFRFNKETIGAAYIKSLGANPLVKLRPQFKYLTKHHRWSMITGAISETPWCTGTRAAIVLGTGETDVNTYEACFKALKDLPLSDAELIRIESFLSRKNTEFRHATIAHILSRSDETVLASAARLLAVQKVPCQEAGLEMLRRMSENDRARQQCRKLVKTWSLSSRKISDAAQTQIDAVLGSHSDPEVLPNEPDLLERYERSVLIKPQRHDVTYATTESINLLLEISRVFEEHKLVEVTNIHGNQELLQSVYIPYANTNYPIEQQLARLPLANIWQEWLANRPASTRDADGYEWVRARALLRIHDDSDQSDMRRWIRSDAERKTMIELPGYTKGKLQIDHYIQMYGILRWLAWMDQSTSAAGYVDFCMNAAENLLAMVSEAEMEELVRYEKEHDIAQNNERKNKHDWRTWSIPAIFWFNQIESIGNLTLEQKRKRYALLRWFHQPAPNLSSGHMSFRRVVEGFDTGIATLGDVAHHILGPRKGYFEDFDTLKTLTTLGKNDVVENLKNNHPEILDLVDQCRNNILEIELKRGEAATKATNMAFDLRSVLGVELLVTLLKILGDDGFNTTRHYRSIAVNNKRSTLTHLIRISYPAPTDTLASSSKVFKDAVKAGNFPKQRLLQLGFLAPQWITSIEYYLGWKGTTEAYYWFFAHMKPMWDNLSNIELADYSPAPTDNTIQAKEGTTRKTIETRWSRIIQQRTSLNDKERAEGLVDVAWFNRTREQLSNTQWQTIADSARFASSVAQAKRAAFVGEVLTGKASRKELIAGIEKRHLKENVRLLGLLPLSATDRDGDISERYDILQAYRIYANKLSGLSKPEATQACDVAFDNLARTAGFKDPLRLAWALEAPLSQDLSEGFLEHTEDSVTMRLDLNTIGDTSLLIFRGDKPLKKLPASHRKYPDFLALQERTKDIKKQISRSSKSLEAAMIAGVPFTGRELQMLAHHNLLWPLLTRLVFIGNDAVGYPDKGGKKLRDHAGTLNTVKVAQNYRIAHAHDFLTMKNWSKWQRECFASERTQPFKQLFRELYVLTEREKSLKRHSPRYDGQQVNPGQAMALWSARGWHTKDTVWKSFSDKHINVSVEFDYDGDYGDSDRVLTLQSVSFQQHDSSNNVDLSSIDPVVFSEVMRDIDLVVSVAHCSDFDPEATLSTVELRSQLIQETCLLLGYKNVTVKKNHAVICGEFGDYSLHLGSGLVHRMPGGQLCMAPVHTQHRGRLFLPFADDDPKTAEIVTKMLVLARDGDIRDPSILEQLRG